MTALHQLRIGKLIHTARSALGDRAVRGPVGVLVPLLVLAASAGGQITSRERVSSSGLEGNDSSATSTISGDGRFVAFSSNATTLVPQGVGGVMVRDRQTGQTELVSLSSAGVPGDGGGAYTDISVDGRFVAFTSGS